MLGGTSRSTVSSCWGIWILDSLLLSKVWVVRMCLWFYLNYFA